MKLFLLVLLTFFISIEAFTQISFSENVVIDDTNEFGIIIDMHNADIDGDGDIDVVVAAKSPGRIVWYENNDGLGNFSEPQLISNSIAPTSMIVEDVDGDLDLDIIISASGTQGINWFENTNGQGLFSEFQSLISISFTLAVHASDIDNDNDIDLIVGTANDGVKIYKNQGGLDFQPSGFPTSNGTVTSITTGDIDNDGDMDLFYNIYAWRENIDGNGTFGNLQSLDGDLGIDVNDPFSRRLYDIDGDNDLDVLASSIEKTVWFENTDGMGNFSSEIIITNGGLGTVAVDVDNDNDLDIVTNSETEFGFAWFENVDGLGNFTQERSITPEYKSFISVAADLNNDGTLDVITTQGEVINWYTFDISQENLVPSNFVHKHTENPLLTYPSDIDGDGDDDIISYSESDNRIGWFENTDGLGTFGEQRFIGIVNNLRDIYSEDLDNDGDKDIIFSSYNKIIWFENLDGNGNFSMDQNIVGPFEFLKGMGVFDIDGDGLMDILSAQSNSVFVLDLVWYKNNGAGGFTPTFITDLDENTNEIKFLYEDFDLDGFKDIIVNSIDSGWQNALIKGVDGLGTFGPRNLFYTSADSEIVLKDMDDDTDLDVILVSDGDLVWYASSIVGTGSENIIAENSSSFDEMPKSFDVDGDGDNDIIYATTFKIEWYENLDGQGGLFSSAQSIAANTSQKSLEIADFNQDGNKDLLIGVSFVDTILWYEHSGVNFNSLSGSINLTDPGMVCDPANPAIPNLLVVSDNGIESLATFTDNSGNYEFFPEEGAYTTTISGGLPPFYEAIPPSQTTIFTGVQNTEIANFCIESILEANDLNITLYPLNEARPGFEAHYQLVFKNVGTTVLSGDVLLFFDDSKMSFSNASQVVNTQTINSLAFEYSDLNPYETRTIDLDFQVFTPPTVNAGDALTFEAKINPVIDDYSGEDNTFVLDQIVVNSLDPNDISVLEGAEIFIEDIDNYLHYIIRFQNTGTASAINVRVTNELDLNLDWSTIQIENISHPNEILIRNGNQVAFIFDNINLPDANTNEPDSHGFIQYKIKPLSTLNIGDSMSNTANIFFDFNAPIITNTVSTTIVDETLDVTENSLENLLLFPNPSKDIVHIKSSHKIVATEISNQLGQRILAQKSEDGIEKIDLVSLPQGIYFIKMQLLNNKVVIQKIIKE